MDVQALYGVRGDNLTVISDDHYRPAAAEDDPLLGVLDAPALAGESGNHVDCAAASVM